MPDPMIHDVMVPEIREEVEKENKPKQAMQTMIFDLMDQETPEEIAKRAEKRAKRTKPIPPIDWMITDGEKLKRMDVKEVKAKARGYSNADSAISLKEKNSDDGSARSPKEKHSDDGSARSPKEKHSAFAAQLAELEQVHGTNGEKKNGDGKA